MNSVCYLLHDVSDIFYYRVRYTQAKQFIYIDCFKYRTKKANTPYRVIKQLAKNNEDIQVMPRTIKFFRNHHFVNYILYVKLYYTAAFRSLDGVGSGWL